MERRDVYWYLSWVAMIAVPLGPAFFFGFSFASDVLKLLGEWAFVSGTVAIIVSVIVGIVAGGGLELVGILSGHGAVRFWNRGEEAKAGVAALILIGYVSLGVIGLEDLLSKGVVMFLIAPLVYLLVAMKESLQAVETAEAIERQDDREWQRKLEIAKLKMRHDEKMERIRAKSTAQKSQIIAEASQSATYYECTCGQVYEKPQSYSAHTRHCDDYQRVAANGEGR